MNGFQLLSRLFNPGGTTTVDLAHHPKKIRVPLPTSELENVVEFLQQVDSLSDSVLLSIFAKNEFVSLRNLLKLFALSQSAQFQTFLTGWDKRLKQVKPKNLKWEIKKLIFFEKQKN